MIVYHLRRSSEIAELLANGLRRSEGRHFMFNRWQDAALLLSGLYRQPGGEADPHVALVIDADDDMLVSSPIPETRLPRSLRADDIRQLQEHSWYAEVDVSTHRIRDVKNGFGDSVLNRFQSRSERSHADPALSGIREALLALRRRRDCLRSDQVPGTARLPLDGEDTARRRHPECQPRCRGARTRDSSTGRWHSRHQSFLGRCDVLSQHLLRHRRPSPDSRLCVSHCSVMCSVCHMTFLRVTRPAPSHRVW